MNDSFKGACLCGSVTFECNAAPVICGHCYCIDCRKASGTGHGSHILVPKDAVTISGEVKVYDAPADSGNVISRMFCPTCGSAVYSLNSGMPDLIFLRASALEDPEVFQPQMAVYTSRAPSWDPIDPGLQSFSAMPEEMPV
jgi:hypothetical protein